jgi:biotin transport system substrate-specific component
MALCAHVSLPLFFTPVPLTLQTFGVLLIALCLGPGRAFAALSLYLVEGAAGLPVFAAGPGGIAQLIAATGGYLLAYPLSALVTGALAGRSKNLAGIVLAAIAGQAIIFVLGAGWLEILTRQGLGAILNQAVLPFLPGEVLKIAAAVGLTTAWRSPRAESR